MLKKSIFFLVLFLGSFVVSHALNSTIILKQPTLIGNVGIAETDANALYTADAFVPLSSFTITAQKSSVHVCNQTAGQTATFTFNYVTEWYTENTNISISGADPALTNAGVTYGFSTPLGSSSTTFTVVVANIDALPVGSYNFTVNGVSDGGTNTTDSETVTIEIDAKTVGAIAPQFPVNGTTGVPVVGTTFSGTLGADTDFFTLQLSKDPEFSFTSLLIDVQVVDVFSYVSTITLDYSTVYYWRVKGANHCDFGKYSSIQTFQTEIYDDSCTSYNGELNKPIQDNGITISPLTVNDSFTLSDVNVTVDITHQFLGNLTISLISPSGTEVFLKADDYCGSQSSIHVTFNDEAAANYNCVVTTSAKPVGSLSNFDTQNSAGEWKLKIIDDTAGATGTLNSWSLGLCEAIPGTSTNSVLSTYSDYNFKSGASGSILLPVNLEATSTGSSSSEQVFTITELPTYTLLKNGVAFTKVGQTFTQNDIDNQLITYNNTASVNETDTFIVHVTNATRGFLGNKAITINLAADANLSVDTDFFEKTGITVYPTVSNGDFNIRTSAYVGKTKIALYTFTGLKAYAQEFDFNNSTTHSFSVPSLASGVYILKLTADNLEGSQKLVIK